MIRYERFAPRDTAQRPRRQACVDVRACVPGRGRRQPRALRPAVWQERPAADLTAVPALITSLLGYNTQRGP